MDVLMHGQDETYYLQQLTAGKGTKMKLEGQQIQIQLPVKAAQKVPHHVSLKPRYRLSDF